MIRSILPGAALKGLLSATPPLADNPRVCLARWT